MAFENHSGFGKEAIDMIADMHVRISRIVEKRIELLQISFGRNFSDDEIAFAVPAIYKGVLEELKEYEI